MVRLLGPGDRLLKTVEREHPRVRVLARGNELTFSGERGDVAAAEALVREIADLAQRGVDVEPDEVERSQRLLSTPGAPPPAQVLGEAIVSSRGRTIRPKTLGQKSYVDAIEQHTITFGIGPAGTGKTYLAMAK
ncbi:MAG: phosphate starvation-inducible protein PhoH, partial [Microbacteriaceae bacterium]|nr:phosphate starvation-inducible protein PhoH [Microbacteriaceae bacterium]